MSTALRILPRVWATAESRPTLARAVETITHRHTQTFVPGRRKGPHSLRLVQARAVQPSLPKPPAPRPLPVLPQPELAFYRKYTEAMLRRYFQLSLQAGRAPTLIGRDVFRGYASHCTVTGFDDAVIFVEDVNKCLRGISAGERFLVRKIAIEGYTMGETAALKGLSLRWVLKCYTGAIDKLSRIFLERKLLNSMEAGE